MRKSEQKSVTFVAVGSFFVCLAFFIVVGSIGFLSVYTGGWNEKIRDTYNDIRKYDTVDASTMNQDDIRRFVYQKVTSAKALNEGKIKFGIRIHIKDLDKQKKLMKKYFNEALSIDTDTTFDSGFYLFSNYMNTKKGFKLYIRKQTLEPSLQTYIHGFTGLFPDKLYARALLELEFTPLLNAEQNEAQKQTAEALISQVKDASVYDKIKQVHDWILDNTDYDKDYSKEVENKTFRGYDYQDISYGSIVNGKAICSGYARAFAYYMHRLGIPCVVMVGYAEDEYHAWNLVKIANKWYYVDTTWDDSSANINESDRYKYFLKGSDSFTKNHENDPKYYRYYVDTDIMDNISKRDFVGG